MSSRFNVLMYGEPAEVRVVVDAAPLDESEVSAVILNLLTRVERLEAQVAGLQLEVKP